MFNEGQTLDALRRRLAGTRQDPALALGIGDDCAIYHPQVGEELLFTTDLTIEDVHFRASTHEAGEIGRLALARGLSDIAAMGGRPRFCLVSLAISRACNDEWIERFFQGLLALASSTGTTLAGGDLARAAQIACDIVVCGSAPRGTALRRSGAHPGDSIFVSGQLGGSALGLATGQGPAWERHLRPEPRLALGQYLRRRIRATAAMDLSDGLSLDLERLCFASGVSASITMPPVYPEASTEHALHGGEDYELLFTVRPQTFVPAQYRGVSLTLIGDVTEGRAGLVLLDGAPLQAGGYDHLR